MVIAAKIMSVKKSRNREVIRVEHLSLGYGEEAVVEDISFSVHAGEIVTILGSSGRLKPAKRNDRSAAADGGNHSNPGRGNIRPRGPWQWTSGNGPSAFSSNPAPCSVLLTRRMRRIEDSPT